MSIDNIISLLEFCITSTYFSFQGKFYEQVEGAAMGSPLSPIVANIYMENFEVEAMRSAPSPPQFWKRYVDDTFTILQSSKKEEFLEYLNSIDQQIQFTAENQREDGAMPFLDILVSPGRDGSLSTSVYRKPTHTDLYLQWESHHTLPSKYSVIGHCSTGQIPSALIHSCCIKKKTLAPSIEEVSVPHMGPEQNKTQDEESRYKNNSQ